LGAKVINYIELTIPKKRMNLIPVFLPLNEKNFIFEPYYYKKITEMEKSETEKIDKLDRQILEIISKNARIPFKEVAEACGVSRAAIHQRVQRLIESGVIVGSGYHINPKILGYNTCTYIGITLERGSMYKDVVPKLEKIPEVVEIHFTTGPYTMLIKLYARDNENLMELVNGKIQEIPGVTETETLISLRTSLKREVPI
jgi:Lrp/AsnC family transcriptional regulator for asnA, asnC and gidA